jgi:hypothetical protein
MGEIAMQPVIRTLHSFFDSLLNSPHHLMMYLGGAAVLLIGIPLVRMIFRSTRTSEEAPSLSTASSSMLGLSTPAIDFKPAAPQSHPPATSAMSNVTAINESLTVPCIHCGVTMSSRQDFCPACGYAQPMKRSFTA